MCYGRGAFGSPFKVPAAACLPFKSFLGMLLRCNCARGYWSERLLEKTGEEH